MKKSISLNSKFIVKTKLKRVNDVYILPPGYIPNEVGVKIIKYCDGKHSVKDIIKLISKEFDGSNELIKKDVLNFIRKLLFLSLIKVV